MPNKLVSTRELAEALGVYVDTVHNLRDAGRITGYKLGKEWRWDVEQVREQLAEPRSEGEQTHE